MDKAIIKVGKDTVTLDGVFNSFKLACNIAKKADTKKSGRTNLDKVLIHNDKVVATDGHQLFVSLPVIDYKAGMYEVLSSTAKVIILQKTEEIELDTNYPDFPKVVELIKRDLEFHLNGTDFSCFYSEIIKHICEHEKDTEDNCTINYQFLLDMFKTTKYCPKCLSGMGKYIVKIDINSVGEYYVMTLRMDM